MHCMNIFMIIITMPKTIFMMLHSNRQKIYMQFQHVKKKMSIITDFYKAYKILAKQ